VINAICHALGVKDVPMPATPYTVWKAANSVRNSAVIR
jgi:carbon-monoxide dehydrogenase large subunit